MQKFVHTSVILASAVVLAATTVGCARQGDSDRSSSSITGPSSVDARSGGGSGGGGKKGGGGTTTGSSSLALVMVNDGNGDGLPNWNDVITFSLSTTATSPFVAVDCYQGSSWVYTASVGYFDAYPWAKQFVLSATSWPGGAADCTALLYTSTDGSSRTTLATLPFHVSQ